LSLSPKWFQSKRPGVGLNSSDDSKACDMPSRFEQDFKIIKSIGSGNFGKVWECSNKLDGVRYAVKITNGDVKSN
jgi:serine/threonine protein kinase